MAMDILSSLKRRFRPVRTLARLCHQRFPAARTFPEFNKIFCVGWLKTGTTSFGHALKLLGFKHCSWDKDIWVNWYKQGHTQKVVHYARYFESFDDLPWNKVEILEDLDKEYPNSKFILLERDEESWCRSFQSHRVSSGMPPANEEELQEALNYYRSRNEFVKTYFQGEKSKQLLTMNIIAGEGFEKLCPFLGVPTPSVPFPHSNKSKVRSGSV